MTTDRGRPLYMIGVVAEMLKVHPQTLRFYEKKGLVRPSRTEGQTRMYSAEDVDEIAGLEPLTGGGHELHESLPGVASLPHDEMAEITARVGLRVRLEPLLARPRTDGVADPVAEVVGEPAALDLEHLVPAAGSMEAESRPLGRRGERVLELVAVVEDLRLARKDRLERRLGDAREPLQSVAHLELLLLELRLVGEILEPAAAALRVMGARGLHAHRPGSDDLCRDSLGVAPLHLGHTRLHRVARQAAAHEDDEAVEPRDTVAAERERLDVELELVAPGDGRRHG